MRGVVFDKGGAGTAAGKGEAMGSGGLGCGICVCGSDEGDYEGLEVGQELVGVVRIQVVLHIDF